MGKAIRNIFKNENFILCECTDGFWLHDKELGMNLSMKAKSPMDACIESLSYYQKRLREVKYEYKILDDKVQNFLSQFEREED